MYYLEDEDVFISGLLKNHLPSDLSNVISSYLVRNPIAFFKKAYKKYQEDSTFPLNVKNNPEFNRNAFFNILRQYQVTNIALDNTVVILDLDNIKLTVADLTANGCYLRDDIDDMRITISNGESAVYYITNTTWDMYPYNVPNISCYGPVTTVGDMWIYNGTVTSIDFNGLSSLLVVGRSWMCSCCNLNLVDFNGLSTLDTVEGAWLGICDKLTSVRFDSLPNLRTVGSNWLHGCDVLTSVDCSGLSRLSEIGDGWLGYCPELTSVTFDSLSNLKKVGHHWLCHCRKLQSVHFNGLSRLEQVGNDWMGNCSLLSSIEFNGLSSLSQVGRGWMSFCAELVSIDFSPLTNLSRVGFHCLFLCPELRSVTINRKLMSMKEDIENSNPCDRPWWNLQKKIYFSIQDDDDLPSRS